MDLPSNPHNNPSPSSVISHSTTIPQDLLLNPQISELIKNLVDSQVQKQVQEQVQETDEGLPVYLIKTRPERSPASTRFFRILDAKREQDIRDDPSRQWKERVRRDPPEPIPTDFKSIPIGMPADYFDHSFFNKLAPRLRVKAARQAVTLLPDVEQSFTYCPEEYLSEAAFTAQYGGERLAQYEFFEVGDYDGEDDV
ncbi:hypothetical protein NMY22_g2204 [Coprinellus aureogranulatus]|nr:hypothetical protein NMY22_g2204 [Coprinellus aureogranulatus]